jgi:hypothetical protein
MAAADQYAYRILTVHQHEGRYLLADWGRDGAEQHFDDAKGLQLALTDRGQDGWRLCQYTAAPDGWPQGMYVLEHLGPAPHQPDPARRQAEEFVSGLSGEELVDLVSELEASEHKPPSS